MHLGPTGLDPSDANIDDAPRGNSASDGSIGVKTLTLPERICGKISSHASPNRAVALELGVRDDFVDQLAAQAVLAMYREHEELLDLERGQGTAEHDVPSVFLAADEDPEASCSKTRHEPRGWHEPKGI